MAQAINSNPAFNAEKLEVCIIDIKKVSTQNT